MSATRRYRFDIQDAVEAGESGHPCEVILRLFPGAKNFEPVPIADCWLFSAERIDNVPSFIVDVTER